MDISYSLHLKKSKLVQNFKIIYLLCFEGAKLMICGINCKQLTAAFKPEIWTKVNYEEYEHMSNK